MESSNEGSEKDSKRLSKEGQAELEAQYNKSDSTSLPKEEKENNKELEQSKNGDKSHRRKQKRKIKAPRNYNKTVRGAIAGMAKNAGKAVGKGAVKALKYTGKKVGRGAIRTAAAIPGAMLGGALSIATGDSSYLLAGASAGAVLGGKAADAIGKAPKNLRSAYRKERLGLQGAAGKERFDEFRKDKENINYFKEKHGVSTKEAKAMMQEGREFIEAGYTNPEDVNRLLQMKEASGGATNDQIMAADQMASQLKLDDFLDNKKSAQLKSNLEKQIKLEAKANGKQITDEKAKEYAHNHMNSMRVAKGLPVKTRTKAKVTRVEKQKANPPKPPKKSTPAGKSAGQRNRKNKKK